MCPKSKTGLFSIFSFNLFQIDILQFCNLDFDVPFILSSVCSLLSQTSYLVCIKELVEQYSLRMICLEGLTHLSDEITGRTTGRLLIHLPTSAHTHTKHVAFSFLAVL